MRCAQHTHYTHLAVSVSVAVARVPSSVCPHGGGFFSHLAAGHFLALSISCHIQAANGRGRTDGRTEGCVVWPADERISTMRSCLSPAGLPLSPSLPPSVCSLPHRTHARLVRTDRRGWTDGRLLYRHFVPPLPPQGKERAARGLDRRSRHQSVRRNK